MQSILAGFLAQNHGVPFSSHHQLHHERHHQHFYHQHHDHRSSSPWPSPSQSAQHTIMIITHHHDHLMTKFMTITIIITVTVTATILIIVNTAMRATSPNQVQRESSNVDFVKGSPRMKNAHNGIWITSTLIYKGNPHSSKKRRPDFHIQICFEHTPTWRKYASVQNSWEATSINIILINIFHHHPYEYHRYHDHRHSIKGPSLCMHCDFIHSRMWTSIMHDCGPGLNM